MAKPKPVPTDLECSLCGLPWDDHGENPTAETCIALLRAELAKVPAYSPPIIIRPYPQNPQWWWETHPIMSDGVTQINLTSTGSSTGPQRIIPGRDDEDPPGVLSLVS